MSNAVPKFFFGVALQRSDFRLGTLAGIAGVMPDLLRPRQSDLPRRDANASDRGDTST